jgi:hypothetical protein
MFIRFVTDRIDEDTGKPLGVFSVAYDLLEEASLADFERSEIRETLNWFKSNLPIPGRFVRSRKPRREDKGMCWFKSTATESMRQIRYLVQLVAGQGVAVRALMMKQPGYLIYEDDFQVVAEPFADTPQ